MRKQTIMAVLLAVCITLLAGCQSYTANPIDPDEIFYSIEKSNIANLKLTLYYLSPNISTRAPLTMSNLIQHNEVQKTIVIGKDAFNAIQAVKEEMYTTKLETIDRPIQQNARLYYIFEISGEKLFDVVFGGTECSMVINGVAVKYCEVYLRIIESFIPEEIYGFIDAWVTFQEW